VITISCVELIELAKNTEYGRISGAPVNMIMPTHWQQRQAAFRCTGSKVFPRERATAAADSRSASCLTPGQLPVYKISSENKLPGGLRHPKLMGSTDCLVSITRLGEVLQTHWILPFIESVDWLPGNATC